MESFSAAEDDIDDGLIRTRKSLYFSACLASPCSIVPAHQYNHQLVASGGGVVEYSRIRRQLQGGGAGEGGDRWSCCRSRSRHLWRRLVRKLLKESKSLYGSNNNGKKQLTFRYDAVSYKQNFDDGSHRSEEDRRRYVADSIMFDRK